ncbi:MTH1187 family thiamine-binding protein [Thermodesulfobacterium sp. TA1]|uniref:MTH1187 family thiamine-binding protein n=1 Tax=Thermodesulfobacterium sp. TA1 TaxID=2234087 RepID=UPI001F0F91A2|nr:MTH1187 family thiamine-binding protein [Thermodesulfobacterium sp. TA1]
MGISIFPLDKGESVSSYVARAVEIIERSNHPYVMTPMETVIETETMEEALKIAEECFKALEKDCNRIIVNIKIDYRKGKSGRIKSKIESVEKKLGRSVSKV